MLASMRVIVFASQKGGSGKTTLSGHIAVEAGRAGYLAQAMPEKELAKPSTPTMGMPFWHQN